MSVRWRGSTKLVEQADSPAFDFSDVNTCTRKFVGPIALCISSRPKRGSSMADYSDFYVDKSTVGRMEGGRGLLTIVATADADGEQVGEGPQYKFEIDMVQIERPLIQHPIFRYGGDWTGWGYFSNPFPNMTSGAYAMNPDELIEIALWEKCPDATIKNQGKYFTDNAKRIPSDGVALSSDAVKLFCSKRLAGIETYAAFHPVAKRTTTQIGPPVLTECGQLFDSEQLGDLGFDSLPSDDSGEDFVYLKSGDTRSRSGKAGKWERLEVWIGASYWDEHIYKVKT